MQNIIESYQTKLKSFKFRHVFHRPIASIGFILFNLVSDTYRFCLATALKRSQSLLHGDCFANETDTPADAR